MSFTRDDLISYESKPAVMVESHDPWNPAPPVAKEPDATPQAKAEETEVDAAIAASVAEPSETGTNDGSTTETEAEPVAADTATPEGDNSPEGEDLTDGKPRNRTQERISELVSERNAAKKYAEYLLSHIDELRKFNTGQPSAASQAAPIVESKEDPAPTLEAAEYDPVKLSKLQNEWIQRQVDKRVDNAVKQLETRQSEVATRQAFESKVNEFRKQAPDFDLVIANPALPSLAPEAARVVVRSDNGPAIAYHLAKNPDLAARISKMEPISQAAAIGRLEEQLVRSKAETKSTSKEPSKPVVPVKQAAVTKAPPPPKPVSGGTSPVNKPAELMSMEEFASQERARKLAVRKEKLALRQAFRR